MAWRPDEHRDRQPRPVVITGAGIVTALGFGWEENAAGLRAGRSAFRPVSLFDVSRQRTRTAGEVDLPDGPPPGVAPRAWARMDRGSRLAWFAAREALASAGLDARQTPWVVGTSAGAMAIGQDYFRQATRQPASRRGQWRRVELYQPARQLATLGATLGLDQPPAVVSNACASGASAIAHAFHRVRSGGAERVLAGGFDALSQMVFAGFDSLQALAPGGIPRPFDAARDGLALGEGAGFVVVEALDAARARGARRLAHLLGVGSATDIHHLTQPHPQGDAALATMCAACRMAGRAPAQVDYLNAHGTGTPLNDAAEAAAIHRWAGAATPRVRVSSTKSAVGHLLGGAGAVEAVVCLVVLEGQWLPASLNVREVDAGCGFELVREVRPAGVGTVLTNSFGFGGSNVTLVFGKEGAA